MNDSLSPSSSSPVINLSCEDLVQDLSFPSVRAWKCQHPGGKVIGYFPVYAPLELIHACGLLPVGLNGAGDQLDIQYADARFGSFICSIVKTTLEMGLTNHLALFDGLLFSSICDSARNLCFVSKRNCPDIYTEFLHLPHNPNSEASTTFLFSEYERLRTNLEQLSGNKMTEGALSDSIEIYNENRRLIRQMYGARAQSPHLIRTSELYSLVRAGNFLPVEEHTALLRKTLHELPQREGKRRDSIRIVIEGSFCEQPPIDLIKIIEEAGCYIVDDDFALGPRWFTEDVPLNGKPLKSLAASYIHRSVYSSVRHDWRNPRHKQLIDKVRKRQADAVLLLVAKFCEPAYFDYVLFKQELEKAGVPHLLMEFEEKMFTFERMRTEIETFVESLLFD
jgi:benzoyl-CoA reductase subunit C